jgi:hypothetical protein
MVEDSYTSRGGSKGGAYSWCINGKWEGRGRRRGGEKKKNGEKERKKKRPAPLAPMKVLSLEFRNKALDTR